MKLEQIKDPKLVRRIQQAMSNVDRLRRDMRPVCNPTAEIPIKAKKRIRQSSKPLMNKLETEFWQQWTGKHTDHLFIQEIRFRLGNGIWYKPDFVCLQSSPILAYEIKGPHAFRGGFENLKIAASKYPNICWVLAWKEGFQWQYQKVLP